MRGLVQREEKVVIFSLGLLIWAELSDQSFSLKKQNQILQVF